jgi:uncharacterized protein DUF3105
LPPKPTKRERKDEAKRRRLEEMKRRHRRARMRKLYVWTALAAVLALIVVGLGLSRASNRKAQNRIKALAATAGCDAPKTFSSEGQTHVPENPPPTYRTNPPTSGNHFNATLKTGIYSVPPPDGNAVHNLEHGHINIWYVDGQVDRASLEALAKIVQNNPTRIILAPRASMQNDYKIAFTAWEVMQGCKTPKSPETVAALAAEFVQQHIGQGLEGDRPGQVGQTTLPPAPTSAPSASPTSSTKASTSPRPTSSVTPSG